MATLAVPGLIPLAATLVPVPPLGMVEADAPETQVAGYRHSGA